MKTNLIVILALLNAALFAQKEYNFASTGRQKLLINPSFAGSSKGLNIQTLGASNSKGSFYSNYTGVDYGGRSFSYGISNTFNSSGNGAYSSNQLDITTSYKIKLNSKLTLIPSLLASYFTRKVDGSKLPFQDLMNIDQCIPTPYLPYQPQDYRIVRSKNNFSASSGLLLDINKKITLGVAVYDINQPDKGLLETQKIALSQVYHISGILFTEKKVQLQPYSILKLQRNGNRYYEVGAYTSYKLVSLHTGFRNTINYNYKDISTIQSRSVYFLLGAHVTYKKVKLGYTYMSIDGYHDAHELFFSANLFNKDKSMQRSLMVN
ncbi:MAG: type IX secretion system membrane protein PorP/SprF [Bacteroidetes bacterium]|nr:type IX secretion system membrane protein PorP/SprF [Bacteroidota bacterium]